MCSHPVVNTVVVLGHVLAGYALPMGSWQICHVPESIWMISFLPCNRVLQTEGADEVPGVMGRSPPFYPS